MHLRTALLGLVASATLASAARATVMVAAGDPSPLGLPFSRFSDAALDDRGRVAFVGASAVLFEGRAGAVHHMLGAGDRSPDGRVIADIGPPAVGHAGVVTRLLFAGGGSGVYRLHGGQLDTLAVAGEPADSGGRFAGFGATVVASGDNAWAAFSALLDNGVRGIFVSDGTVVRKVAATGELSPSGGTFQQLRLLGVTSDGRAGFRAVVVAGPDGLFMGNGTVNAPVAIIGDASPIGGQFVAVGAGSLNDGGTWVFRATVSGPQSGVFRADTSGGRRTLAPVALEGDATPTGEVTFGEGKFRAFASTLVPAIDAGGTIVFRATIANGRVSAAVVLARTGEALRTLVGVGQTTSAGRLAQLRDPVLADDDSVVVPATVVGGTSGLFRVRPAGTVTVSALAQLGQQTDAGGDFRFTDPAVRDDADSAVFLGLREGVFVASARGQTSMVAMLGESTPLGGRYDELDPPAAGPGGRVVFGAAVFGPDLRRALFLAGPSGAVPLVKAGDRAPGGGSIRDFFVGVRDATAHVSVGPGGFAFQADLTHTSGPTGLFVRLGHRRMLVARADQHAPGGGHYTSFGTPAYLGGTRAAFVAGLGGTSGDVGIFLRSGGRTRLLARAGEATGTRVAGKFNSFDSPAAGPPGVAFRALVDQRGRQGLFLVNRRARGVLVATGDAAPDGGRFSGFDATAFAGSRLVFHAAVAGGPRSEGIFRVAGVPQAPPVSVDALASVGGPAPDGGTFVAVGDPAGNSGGAVALTADLFGASTARAIVILP